MSRIIQSLRRLTRREATVSATPTIQDMYNFTTFETYNNNAGGPRNAANETTCKFLTPGIMLFVTIMTALIVTPIITLAVLTLSCSCKNTATNEEHSTTHDVIPSTMLPILLETIYPPETPQITNQGLMIRDFIRTSSTDLETSTNFATARISSNLTTVTEPNVNGTLNETLGHSAQNVSNFTNDVLFNSSTTKAGNESVVNITNHETSSKLNLTYISSNFTSNHSNSSNANDTKFWPISEHPIE